MLVDTFQANPFTGVVYLHHVFEDLGEQRKHEYIAFIDHYENGFKDGLSLSLNTSGEIIQIANYSKGERLGLINYNVYKRMISSYKEKIRSIKSFSRQALHATKLSLNHPITKNYLDFICPLPKDMTQLIDILKKKY